jgi:hypothetical protein
LAAAASFLPQSPSLPCSGVSLPRESWPRPLSSTHHLPIRAFLGQSSLSRSPARCRPLPPSCPLDWPTPRHLARLAQVKSSGHHLALTARSPNQLHPHSPITGPHLPCPPTHHWCLPWRRPHARAPVHPFCFNASASIKRLASCLRTPYFCLPSWPPWTGCLTTPCCPFSGPIEAPRCDAAHGPTSDTSLSPECHYVGAVPPPSPSLGDILPRLLFRLELVLRYLPHPPLTMQDLPELQFTLIGRCNRCIMPSTLVSHTPLPRLLVGHFVSSKHCPTLAR